ncbi:probable BOI-related E3 ubiquitin-protein ligase 3 [Andrographis paniculata]|uniref:probable BOI-related E3 ubiquitin-protein ligase 3 n=1 Tax=Andrographis paniculata TaxID=175694 RepID=UPI0021E79416|nr:probable BOI-related E3 ubiquitin-protein ligase 3 [Andrographis paniculata]
MEVEARRLHPFPTQIRSNRDLGMNSVEGGGNMFGGQIGYGMMPQMEVSVPVYGSAAAAMAAIANNPAETPVVKSDCVLINAPRKRTREEINTLLSSSFPSDAQNRNACQVRGLFTFLGEDISRQMQQQQLEIDLFIALHNKKVRTEIKDRRKRYCQGIAAALEQTIIKKLKAKDDEIEKIGKLNCALEDRLKSLYVENQIWRDLAQTTEATANALRSNLAQLLAQVQTAQPPLSAGDDDAQSCCGSNFKSSDNNDRNKCRKCEKDESCVLLLPCRHLCLCNACGSTLQTCPVCNVTRTGSVHHGSAGQRIGG